MAFVICATELRHWQNKTNSQTSQTGDQQSCCINVAWWGTITSCSTPSLAMRCYFVARSITCLHGVVLSIYHTSTFDAAKKEADDKSSYKADGHTPGFDSIPGTAFSAWISFFPSILVACVGFTKLLWAIECGKLSDWGQSAAVVTTFAGGMHWLYAFVCDTIHTYQHHNGSLTRRPLAAVYSLFGATKNQDLDYGRLNGRSFPHALDAKCVVELQHDLLLFIRIGDFVGFLEAIDAVVRRQKHGEHVSLDFVSEELQTPLTLALARRLPLFAGKLLDHRASIAVPRTRSAIVVAAETGDTTMLKYMIDLGTCDVYSIIEALSALDRYVADNDNEISPIVARYMIMCIENKSMPSDEVTIARLMDLVLACKSRNLYDLLLTSRLLNRFSRDSRGFTIFEGLSADDNAERLTKLELSASRPSTNEERCSALLVALRCRSPKTARILLGLESTERLSDLSLCTIAFDHPFDLLTWALEEFSPRIEDIILGLEVDVAKFVTFANLRLDREGLRRDAAPTVNYHSVEKLLHAPSNGDTTSMDLLKFMIKTAKIEGYHT
jgi:hypothetical protein